MRTLRTVIFVDGQNFKYNLKAFKFRGVGSITPDRYYSLDEKHFQWKEFFAGIVKKFDDFTGFSHHLIRVYWCNAATMRPFESSRLAAEKVAREYQGRYPDLTGEKVMELAKKWHTEQRRLFDQTKDRVFESIQRKTEFLEFKYVGELVVKPLKPYRLEMQKDGTLFYQGTREGEKGVDVGIVVEMIAKMKEFDAAILVSGDADFIPVVRYLKDNLRYVYQFSLARGIPPKINYLSPWLIGCVDVFKAYDELELLGTYLDRHARIPNAVLQAIDERIDELRRTASQQEKGL